MNRGQSMNAIAQIAHLLGETTPRMYLCQVRKDTGQCQSVGVYPVVCYVLKYIANYWVCGILFNLTHVLGSVRRFLNVFVVVVVFCSITGHCTRL